MTLLRLRKRRDARACASKAGLHRGEAAKEPAWKPRVVRKNDPLNLGSHKNYIAPRLGGDNESAANEKGPQCGPFEFGCDAAAYFDAASAAVA